MSHTYRKPSYRFTYGSPLLDRLVLIVPVFGLWAGSMLGIQGFSGESSIKAILSVVLLYLVWHFFASRKPREIRFSEAGLIIPSTWLPGLVEHRVSWAEIDDVDIGSRNNLPTVCLRLQSSKTRHIYMKGLKAYVAGRLSASPGEKLFLYLCDVLGIEKQG